MCDERRVGMAEGRLASRTNKCYSGQPVVRDRADSIHTIRLPFVDFVQLVPVLECIASSKEP